VASASTRFEDMSVEQWNREIAVNLTGTMLCCQVFGSVMESGASIINIASIYGLVAPDQSIYPTGFFKPAAYGVTKAGVINLTKYLAGYWGEKNIRVNCLVLGGVENSQDPTFIAKYASKTPLRRMADVNDYQGAIVYFASDASSYSTGSILCIDGGWTAL
jgi:NAD(P)-dependent dehydrogenase (short-subunit alcohol dehydrogenase family)